MKNSLLQKLSALALLVAVALPSTAQTTITVQDQVTVNGGTATLADGSGTVAYTNADNAVWYLGTFNLAQVSSIEVKGAAFVSDGSGNKSWLRIAAVAPGQLPDVNTTSLGNLSGTIRSAACEVARIVAETTPTTVASGKNPTNYAGANFTITTSGVTYNGGYDGTVTMDDANNVALSKNSGLYQLFVYGKANKGRLAIDQIIMHYANESASSATSTIGSSADTYVRLNNTSNFGTKTVMEIHTDLANATAPTDFVGLMSFTLPEAAVGKITSAKLRLVTNNCKGSTTMNIYPYGNAFAESTTYDAENSYITAARQSTPIIFNVAYGVRGKSLTADAFTDNTDVAAWTNIIDITSLVNAAASSSFQIMLDAGTAGTNKDEFFTKEAVDVTNTQNNVTYLAADLVPQLTITYSTGTSVDTYQLTMTDAQAATLTLPFDATLPAGLKAYTLAYTSGAAAATPTEVTGTLAANTPVLVNAAAGSYAFAAINGKACPEVATASTYGALNGVYADTQVAQGNYVLQNQNGDVAFFIVDANSGNIVAPAYTAYLTADTAAAAKIGTGLSNPTAISSIKAATQTDGAIYNLAGQRVDKSYKGIIIVNGKKYLNR